MRIAPEELSVENYRSLHSSSKIDGLTLAVQLPQHHDGHRDDPDEEECDWQIEGEKTVVSERPRLEEGDQRAGRDLHREPDAQISAPTRKWRHLSIFEGGERDRDKPDRERRPGENEEKVREIVAVPHDLGRVSTGPKRGDGPDSACQHDKHTRDRHGEDLHIGEKRSSTFCGARL